MMQTGYATRLWTIGGAAGAAAVLVLSWFLLISPQNGRTGALEDEAALARAQAATLETKLSKLREQNQNLFQYTAELERARQALPEDSGMSEFLRSMQAAGNATAVDVDRIAVQAPTQVNAAGKAMYSLPLTMTANGTAANIDRFLNALQMVEPRAVLVDRLEVTAGEMPGNRPETLAGNVSVSLDLTVFVSPPPGIAPVTPDEAAPAPSPSN
jgi:type IV pilus assembly protein PilO